MSVGRLWNRYVMHRRRWWIPLAAVLAIGVLSMLYMGVRTYSDAPPVPDFVDEKGATQVGADAIRRGQAVFLKYGLMNYGSFFGDGAGRGPDFTADALHRVAIAMRDWHASSDRADADSALAAAQREIRRNRYDEATNTVHIGAAQAYAARDLERQVAARFRGEGNEPFHPAGWISDDAELRDLAAFFFWGAWVCGAERPGESYSYTHNWPYDEFAGNRPSAQVVLWSAVAVLALVAALGGVLFAYGRYSTIAGWRSSARDTSGAQAQHRRRIEFPGEAIVRSPLEASPSALQRATWKFFVVAVVLFVLQMVAGILTVHDFLGITRVFGVDLAETLPIPIVRGWHLQLALLWITACWIGSSIFVISTAIPQAIAGQRRLVDAMFVLLVVTAVGGLAGVALGPHGVLGEHWHWLGSQGWEFVEQGRLWQAMLFVVIALWAIVLARAVVPTWRAGDAWTLPKWLVWCVACVLLLFLSGFVSGPETNFVVADFWRWAVIHMWVEAFFEVFATALLAYCMVLMRLVSHAAASRIVYLATLLFLGSGLLGISHNFYWNAKPVVTLAIGSVFSTLQVVPLILLTLEAWQFRNAPQRAGASFAHGEAFLFLLGVNFWNFLGAGMFGFLINLPIVNYYEHGTYLTVNHGHAALMGVYGNLAIAMIVFCARSLVEPARWNASLLRIVFWSINIGLMGMVVLDLFPVGVAQLLDVLENGLWHARSQAFVQADLFQALTWARIVGGAVFVLGGVLPLAWFVLTRSWSLKAAQEEALPAPTRSLPAPSL
ncbi:MAG: cbb3-type cytochrome c oxidase subunit I [Burkholderiaceae bacterium]|jgi:nitric oxide reductase subunit B|nr:cbb3-type cytochrome c oxidase subunit I [Burkholderiaceae bacterium]